MNNEREKKLNEQLIEASIAGDLVKLKKLISNGADVHADDDSALMCAVHYDYLEIVKCLVEQGADIHAKNDSALVWASKWEHLEIVKYFILEHDCDPQIALKADRKENKVIFWCEKYIESKKLNDSLELDLKKEDGIVNTKKVKV